MALMDIKNLSKWYGKFRALDNLNLSIPRGRIVGLLGKNGAGKSTLMRSMLGFLHYEGEILYDGRCLKDIGPAIFERIAFIPDVNGLDERLTARQLMRFVADVNPSWKEASAQNLLDKSNLPLDKKVSQLSKGMKTKLYLLITLALDAEFLLLDEPTLGLDIAFRKDFFNTILGEYYDDSKTILISTHQVEEVEHILQDIIFIDQGKVILYEDIETLKSRFRAISIPVDRRSELMVHNPKLVTMTLGRLNAIVTADVEIEGAEYARPGLSDLFLAELGGSNE